MTPLGYLVGRVDPQVLVTRLKGDVVVRYGAFLNTVVDFVIAAVAVSLIVRGVSAV